jgi:deoxycytidylate deaminase
VHLSSPFFLALYFDPLGREEEDGTDDRCPCLRCSVKIVQCGVREVVYNQSYSMDEASAAVLKEGGVILRQLHMP